MAWEVRADGDWVRLTNPLIELGWADLGVDPGKDVCRGDIYLVVVVVVFI